MIVLRRTGPYSRTQLRVARAGLVTEYLRPAVGGGYFVEASITVPWFNEKLEDR